ncbi:MAG: cupin domain-containing protein [Mongoliitalea sp.]
MKLVVIQNTQAPRTSIFDQVRSQLTEYGFRVISEDQSRPWGGFFVIDEDQIREFKELFFSELEMSEEQFQQKLSPKVLLVEPLKRLSWQYHHRRSEVWKLLSGNGAICRSFSDEEGPVEDLIPGRIITLATGERHRLIGKDSWGIVAEIWQHVDINNPSNEEDIVRVQDDFKRK